MAMGGTLCFAGVYPLDPFLGWLRVMRSSLRSLTAGEQFRATSRELFESLLWTGKDGGAAKAAAEREPRGPRSEIG